MIKVQKQSKTRKRNSKKPLHDDIEMQDQQPHNVLGEPNLDSSKVLNWADLFKTKFIRLL